LIRISRFVGLSSTTSARTPASGVARPKARRAEASCFGSSISNQNVVPRPGSLSNASVPPIIAMSRFAIASPRPVPP
jgi:hypothetical protein